MDNSLEAFSSNPRYSPDGLDGEIEKEELAVAQRVDTETAAVAKLQEVEEVPQKEVAQEEDVETAFDPIAAHEKILGVVDTVTRVPRDIVGGAMKAVDNTMSLVVGRENLDSANEWLRKEMPDLVAFTDSYAKGITPQGTASEITQELSQFVVPFGAYMKGIKAMSVASGVKTGVFTQGFLADIVTSGTALDPHMDRLASLAKEMGVDNKIVGWLADNENETDSQGRLKNILENAGLGIGITAAFISAALPLKGLWKLSKTPRKPRAKKKAKKKTAKKAEPKEDIGGQIKELLKMAEAT